MKTILILILILTTLAFAEHPDTTLSKLQQRKELIKSASKMFDVNSKILSSIIYVERTLNYTWEDDALDSYLAEAGLNSSIGFCQVKLKTANWIEVQLNDAASIYFPNEEYRGILALSQSPAEIIIKLKNDSLNILYASAYIRIILSRWSNAGFPINGKADIIGTLYSTGLFKRNGSERAPNNIPKSNNFGLTVKNIFLRNDHILISK